MLKLSDTTKAYLDGICFASNFFWTEGGMSYKELTSTEWGDCKVDDREKIPFGSAQDFYAEPHNQLAKLSWFLHGAFGHNTDVHPSHLPITTVCDGILSRINADIQADWFTAELEEHPYGMDIRILFADVNDQVLCLLKLAWRID
jgi:hypothetical protein